MNDDPNLAWLALSKVFGVSAGAFIALVFIPPKTLREFASRVVVSIGAGIIFAHPLREYLEWGADSEHIVAAAALAAFISWWAAGLIVRVLNAKSDFSKP